MFSDDGKKMRLSPSRALFAVTTALVALALVELGMRAVFSVVAGRSLFLYGTGSGEPAQKPGMLFPGRMNPADWHRVLAADDREKAFHEHESGPYSKYRPHQYKRNRDQYGHLSEIRINNRGFRGDDFALLKTPGLFRVIALGASSTFGYRNRDHETYPHYMQQYLNDALAAAPTGSTACPGVERFEVINFGIPHLNSSNIRSLFLAEGLDLAPDVVTFYEGANETRLLEPSFAQRSLSALGSRLLTARFIQFTMIAHLSSFTASELTSHLEGLSENFLRQVSLIADACESRGIGFVVASQQAKSFLLSADEMKGVSYAEEARLVRQKLDSEGRIGLKELIFLMHVQLMEDLRGWAHDGGVAFVDLIAELDERDVRDQLLSWVHLSAEANRVVAAELAGAVLQRACRAPSEPG